MAEIIVFFDIGGTLVDAPDIFEVVTKRLVGGKDSQTYGLVVKTYERMISEIRNNTIPFESVAGLHAISLEELARRHGYRDISSEAQEITIGVYGHQSEFYPETHSVLNHLLANNVRMIIASDNDREILEVQKKKHNLSRYFSDFCISEDARAYKPAPGFVNRLRKFVSHDSSSCFFVGDMPFDVECGKLLGIKSVLVSRNNQGISSADYFVHDLEELIPLLGLEQHSQNTTGL
ncbi:HAD family hydrolase [Chloroflexota bacterium]